MDYIFLKFCVFGFGFFKISGWEQEKVQMEAVAPSWCTFWLGTGEGAMRGARISSVHALKSTDFELAQRLTH